MFLLAILLPGVCLALLVFLTLEINRALNQKRLLRVLLLQRAFVQYCQENPDAAEAKRRCMQVEKELEDLLGRSQNAMTPQEKAIVVLAGIALVLLLWKYLGFAPFAL